MSEIDWSKPIEVYGKQSCVPVVDVVDAEVIATGLKGPHPYAVLWHLPETDRIGLSSENGVLYETWWWGVRNKPEVHRQILVVAITSRGVACHFTYSVRETAEEDLRDMLDTGVYVAGQVVELEWTEE